MTDMQKSLSSGKFIGAAIVLILGAVALWFIVPPLHQQISRVHRNAKNYVVAVTIPQQAQKKIEQDIRDIEDKIKRGDTQEDTVLAQYLRLGINFETIGRLDLAIDAYQKAAIVDPTSFVPYANMGTTHEAAKEYEAAKDAFQKAIGIVPQEPSNYQKLAELYSYKLNEIAVARGVFLQGLMGTNQEPNLVRSYASFLDRTGYTSESLLYWQVVLKNSPNDESVKTRIKELTPTPPAPKSNTPVKKK